jgi:hypothetical protein
MPYLNRARKLFFAGVFFVYVRNRAILHANGLLMISCLNRHWSTGPESIQDKYGRDLEVLVNQIASKHHRIMLDGV